MEYFKELELKDGTECVIRNCNECDCNDVLEVLGTAHKETDFLPTFTENRLFRRSIV